MRASAAQARSACRLLRCRRRRRRKQPLRRWESAALTPYCPLPSSSRNPQLGRPRGQRGPSGDPAPRSPPSPKESNSTLDPSMTPFRCRHGTTAGSRARGPAAAASAFSEATAACLLRRPRRALPRPRSPPPRPSPWAAFPSTRTTFSTTPRWLAGPRRTAAREGATTTPVAAATPSRRPRRPRCWARTTGGGSPTGACLAT